MRTMKKVLCLILVMGLVLSLLPTTALATDDNVVYLSVSFDDKYITDKNGEYIAYMPVSLDAIESIDLVDYGLENMLFDADGDGEYETTALQLLIYAHEELYGGDWGDVNFDALPGSSYFRGGIFGFTENLVYFLNGDFPVDESMSSDYMTTGATSDRIVLEAGDFLDVASFECYSFLWDQQGGFHLFADQNGDYVHDYAANAGEPMPVKLKHSFCDLMFGESWVKDAVDYEVHYGTVYGNPEGTVVTDDEGNAAITFPSAGTYYVWCFGGIGSDDGTHTSCDHYMASGEPCIVSAPAYAKVTVTGTVTPEPSEPTPSEPTPSEPTPSEPTPSEPSEPQQPGNAEDVSTVLNATMAQLAATVAEPAFGTNAGEWTVFDLARSGYFASDSTYFADYYDRIVEYVNTTAAEVGMNGALDANKSTDNSRLIMALASIGRDATSVGNWNLVEAYSANGMNWIKKQGMNGTIWTLIALDCGNYETSEPTIRQQCVDAIIAAQHDDGGWSLVTAAAQPSNVDITGMALTALYPYRNQPDVAAACQEAFAWMSESQLANGGFPYGNGETAESCVWAIVAATTWGINPDTDSRFIKNGISAVDNLLTYYIEDEARFSHVSGGESNAMATDQAGYALIAYDRFINGKSALYDYSDVVPVVTNPDAITATLSIPKNIENKVGATFNAIISVDKWNNEGGYKLVDFVMTIPEALTVTGVTAGSRLEGGEVSFHVDSNGLLRCVYFDANENSDLTITGEEFPAEVFTVSFQLEQTVSGELPIAISGMSIKRSSDSTVEDSMIQVEISTGEGSGGVVKPETGITVSAMELYTGDGVDLIPADKKAVAVAVTGIDHSSPLVYNDGTNEIQLYYSGEITAKTGISTYVALVSKEIKTANFSNKAYYTANGTGVDPLSIAFGDTNSDAAINAQDALAVVDAWLRKGEEPTDDMILRMNVNGDSRINTFDALGIVEAFVNGDTFRVITKAATIAGN